VDIGDGFQGSERVHFPNCNVFASSLQPSSRFCELDGTVRSDSFGLPEIMGIDLIREATGAFRIEYEWRGPKGASNGSTVLAALNV
jgi:hypothetical protein